MWTEASTCAGCEQFPAAFSREAIGQWQIAMAHERREELRLPAFGHFPPVTPNPGGAGASRTVLVPARAQFGVDAPGAFYYCAARCGGVAQLVRALPCHGRGYGFEPRRSRQFLSLQPRAVTDRLPSACPLHNPAILRGL